MSDPSSFRRECARCARPQSHCLCAHVPSLSTHTKVLVLQHPDEARHAMNTARLAVLGLRNAQLWVGVSFEHLAQEVAAAQTAMLLFPPDKDSAKASRCEPADRGPDERCDATSGSVSIAQAGGHPLLIVPDGTWRKARKIVAANPILQGLPRLSLRVEQPSQYTIRKTREPSAVSTVEAIVYALQQLEPQGDFQALLAPFHAMVAQQIHAMGPDVFQRNYR